jgi:hypothetical protein
MKLVLCAVVIGVAVVFWWRLLGALWDEAGEWRRAWKRATKVG